MESDASLLVYPNPSQDKIIISLDPSVYYGELIIDVYSVSGERLIHQANAESIDVSLIPSGNYILKVQNGSASWTKKIIRE